MSAPIAFAGAVLDRADPIRSDPDRLRALMEGAARLLRLDGLDPVIGPDGALAWGALADAPPEAELVFLGLDGQGPGARGCFAPVPAAGSVAPANPRLWQAMATLGPADLATYGGARSLGSVLNQLADEGMC